MAGCCHGRACEWGIYHVNLGMRVIPVQLFEALFLFALCAFLWIFTAKKAGTGMASYLLLYGIWRFFAEYLRNDDRGATIISFLTPSQLTSLLLVLIGAVLLIRLAVRKKAGG